MFEKTFAQHLQSSSHRNRVAMLLAGASALAYGIFRKDRLKWPMLLGGSMLVGGAASKAIPSESSCEVSFTFNRPVGEIYSYLQGSSNWLTQGSSASPSPHTKLTDQQTDRSLTWRQVRNNGVCDIFLRFQPAPANRGTEVHARLHARSSQTLVTELFRTTTGQSVEQQLREGLRRAKQLLEAGEIATIEGQPHGARGLKGKAERLMMREDSMQKRSQQNVTDTGNQELAAS